MRSALSRRGRPEGPGRGTRTILRSPEHRRRLITLNAPATAYRTVQREPVVPASYARWNSLAIQICRSVLLESARSRLLRRMLNAPIEAIPLDSKSCPLAAFQHWRPRRLSVGVAHSELSMDFISDSMLWLVWNKVLANGNKTLELALGCQNSIHTRLVRESS